MNLQFVNYSIWLKYIFIAFNCYITRKEKKKETNNKMYLFIYKHL